MPQCFLSIFPAINVLYSRVSQGICVGDEVLKILHSLSELQQTIVLCGSPCAKEVFQAQMPGDSETG